jgi:hypothetical protein
LELGSEFAELLRPEFVELKQGWIVLVASFLIFEIQEGLVVLYYGWYMVQVEKSVG